MGTTIVNRKAKFDFELGDLYVAGLILKGCEIKSVAKGHVDLTSAYVMVSNNKARAFGISIKPIDTIWAKSEPNRPIDLLLNKKELQNLVGETIVVTRLFIVGHKAKIEIAVAKKKKKFDHREREKEKLYDRECRDDN